MQNKIAYRQIKKASELVLDDTRPKVDILKDFELYLNNLVKNSEKHRLSNRVVEDSSASAKFDGCRIAVTKLMEVYNQMAKEQGIHENPNLSDSD